MDQYRINSWKDIGKIDFSSLSMENICQLHFVDLILAFKFYNSYAKTRGFSVRKSRSRIVDGKVREKAYVCSREGYRLEKWNHMKNRVRELKPETKCGCMSKLHVFFDVVTESWVVRDFCDEHNHELIIPKLARMLRSYKKMTEPNINQMNHMKEVGISIPNIFGSLASQCGGNENVNFSIKDMHNQVAKQRRQLPDDLTSLDYDLFGDVLAFDTTYKKNRYRLLVVIFSGVNHHNQTVVFGVAIVSNEMKSTYVWLLKQLLIAMKGKTLTSVITDGHPSMAIAIQEVFSNAHHRLCAWHLMHNATSNIHKPQFTKMFTKLMLSDYEVGVFEQNWEEMVGFFRVEDWEWIVDMYGKRNMWATTHIQGKFFAGFRTTSRCESLHSILKRYVKSHHNLTEFVQHFQHCLSYMQHRKDLADFKSSTGQPVIQTHFQKLERSLATIYTRQIFYVVPFNAPQGQHIEGFLDIAELPKSLVLRRWTKKVKEGISGYDDMCGLMEDSLAISWRACLAHWCKQIMNKGCLKGDIFNESRDALVNILSWIRAHNGDNNMMEGHAEYMYEDLAKNGSTEIETTRKPKRCNYYRKGDYSFVDAESDEYVHTEWFEEEDEYLDSLRYYEQSGGETESSMDYDSGANDDDEAEL
ncbi:protein FAR1-RELATED SEQUENCE 5-like [Arachis hypogaea]|uniref:protein FAR1-RELATED SEQUENCE 5-like n=2 Tax=Arachis TaxID=3817 RepID=UPI000DEC05D1|nr:protein FAR1-RELATED SEQUENCE 5-like [Arachis hypogaea]